MKASAAARHSAFKKTGKSTVGARRAAAKASVKLKQKQDIRRLRREERARRKNVIFS